MNPLMKSQLKKPYRLKEAGKISEIVAVSLGKKM